MGRFDKFDKAPAQRTVACFAARWTFAGEHDGLERSAKELGGVDLECVAEGVVCKGQAAIAIAANDHIALLIEKIAIKRFVFRYFPLEIAQLFDVFADRCTIALVRGRSSRRREDERSDAKQECDGEQTVRPHVGARQYHECCCRER